MIKSKDFWYQLLLQIKGDDTGTIQSFCQQQSHVNSIARYCLRSLQFSHDREHAVLAAASPLKSKTKRCYWKPTTGSLYSLLLNTDSFNSRSLEQLLAHCLGNVTHTLEPHLRLRALFNRLLQCGHTPFPLSTHPQLRAKSTTGK